MVAPSRCFRLAPLVWVLAASWAWATVPDSSVQLDRLMRLQKQRFASGDAWLPLERSEYEAVLRGEVFFKTSYSVSSGLQEGLSARFVPILAQNLWMAAVDEAHHAHVFGGVDFSVVIANSGVKRSIYKRYQPPIPFIDPRFWVVEAQHSASLWDATKGQVYQVNYACVANAKEALQAAIQEGIVPEDAAWKGVLVQKCQSSWTFLPLKEGGTIIEYRSASAPIDGLPQSVKQLAMSKAHGSVIQDLMDWLRTGKHSFVGQEHPPLYDPAGSLINLAR